MLAELSRCSSERLDVWIASLPDVAKVDMLRRLQLMRSRLIETLLPKLDFFFHIPFRALGIFWAECGGVLSVCQQICRECIAEYEYAMQLGHRAHRVAHRLFRIGTVCRAELDLWVLASQPLRCFREAYRLLLEYALCPPTERCIEAVHALIQRVGRVATNSNPPYVVAKIRENQSLDELRVDISFYSYVVEQWRPTRLLSTVLSLRIPEDTLRSMTRTYKIKTIYQCTPASQHESIVDRAPGRNSHLQLALAGPVEDPSPEPWKQMVYCLKELFVERSTCSVPRDLFDAALACDFDYSTNRNVLDDLVTISFAVDDNVFESDHLSGQAFFVVTNARPEKRTTVLLQHLKPMWSMIRVSTCTVQHISNRQVYVHQSQDQQASLDLRSSVEQYAYVARSALSWTRVDVAAAVKQKPRLTDPAILDAPLFGLPSSLFIKAYHDALRK